MRDLTTIRRDNADSGPSPPEQTYSVPESVFTAVQHALRTAHMSLLDVLQHGAGARQRRNISGEDIRTIQSARQSMTRLAANQDVQEIPVGRARTAEPVLPSPFPIEIAQVECAMIGSDVLTLTLTAPDLVTFSMGEGLTGSVSLETTIEVFEHLVSDRTGEMIFEGEDGMELRAYPEEDPEGHRSLDFFKEHAGLDEVIYGTVESFEEVLAKLRAQAKPSARVESFQVTTEDGVTRDLGPGTVAFEAIAEEPVAAGQMVELVNFRDGTPKVAAVVQIDDRRSFRVECDYISGDSISIEPADVSIYGKDSWRVVFASRCDQIEGTYILSLDDMLRFVKQVEIHPNPDERLNMEVRNGETVFAMDGRDGNFISVYTDADVGRNLDDYFVEMVNRRDEAKKAPEPTTERIQVPLFSAMCTFDENDFLELRLFNERLEFSVTERGRTATETTGEIEDVRRLVTALEQAQKANMHGGTDRVGHIRLFPLGDGRVDIGVRDGHRWIQVQISAEDIDELIDTLKGLIEAFYTPARCEANIVTVPDVGNTGDTLKVFPRTSNGDPDGAWLLTGGIVAQVGLDGTSAGTAAGCLRRMIEEKGGYFTHGHGDVELTVQVSVLKEGIVFEIDSPVSDAEITVSYDNAKLVADVLETLAKQST